MEIQASLYWTPDYIKRFISSRGYNPVKYLPLMFHQSNSFHGYEAPYNTTFYLEGEGYGDQGKFLQDYRLTLTEGYNEYLKSLELWAQSLGVSHSCQVGYNQPVDLVGFSLKTIKVAANLLTVCKHSPSLRARARISRICQRRSNAAICWTRTSRRAKRYLF